MSPLSYSLKFLFISISFISSQLQLVPLCRKINPDYLLPKITALSCGVPSSRSYLYSQYRAAFELRRANRTESNSKETKFKIILCRLEQQEPKLWIDDISVISPTPITTDLCISTEFNFFARAMSPASVEPVTVSRVSPCEWEARFNPAYSGKYEIEIMNNWIGASYEPNRTACREAVKRAYWLGDVIVRSRNIERGGPSVTCCDRCQLYRCKFWTGTGGNKCIMFENVSKLVDATNTPEVNLSGFIFPNSKLLSGRRKTESTVVHLGGINMQNKQENSLCRTQAHIIGSPTVIYVSSMNPPQVSLEKKICPTVPATGTQGLWVRVNTSLCPRTHTAEIRAVRLLAVQERQVSIVSNRYFNQLYDNVSYSRIYCTGHVNNTDEFCSWFPFNVSISSVPLSNIEREPWQVHPICALRESTAKHISYTTPRGARTDFEWTSNKDCRYRHYSYESAMNCFKKNNISYIYMGGDSVVGGLSQVVKWMINAGPITGNNWYEGSQYAIRNSETVDSSGFIVKINSLKCSLFDAENCISVFKRICKLENCVVILNFDLQHLEYDHHSSSIERAATIFYERFTDAKSIGLISHSTKFIYLNGMANHGFRKPFCTTVRAQAISSKIGDLAVKAGWFVLDGFNMTLLRPEMSVDGMHFGDSVNYMFYQVLMGLICDH